jgi:hypothetical protein
MMVMSIRILNKKTGIVILVGKRGQVGYQGHHHSHNGQHPQEYIIAGKNQRKHRKRCKKAAMCEPSAAPSQP